MDETKRKELAALLIELSIRETHPKLNRYMDKKDTTNAIEIINIENAIGTIFNYLEK